MPFLITWAGRAHCSPQAHELSPSAYLEVAAARKVTDTPSGAHAGIAAGLAPTGGGTAGVGILCSGEEDTQREGHGQNPLPGALWSGSTPLSVSSLLML